LENSFTSQAITMWGIKRVTALPTIAIAIVQAGFFLFAHAATSDAFLSNNATNSVRLQT
jgi:hypothetical protein